MGGGAIEQPDQGATSAIDQQRAIQRETERAEEERSFKPAAERPAPCRPARGAIRSRRSPRSTRKSPASRR